MSEFKVIETQEELDRVIKSRLDRERAKYADYNSLSEKIESLEKEKVTLQEMIDSYKESDSKNATKLSELEKQIKDWELKSLKQNAALNNGLPFELYDRLSGNDEDSLNEDAEKLASLINTKKSIPLKDTEPPLESGNRLKAAFRQAVRDLK